MRECTIKNINKKVYIVYKDWYRIFYKIMIIIFSLITIIEYLTYNHIGIGIFACIITLGFLYLAGIPYRKQLKEIIKIDKFYIVSIRNCIRGTKNEITYYFDYFGKEKSVDAVGGIGYACNIPNKGDDLIVGMYTTKSGKEKFVCVLPWQVEN